LRAPRSRFSPRLLTHTRVTSALFVALAITLSTGGAAAQTGPVAPLPEGTELHVVTANDLSSKTAAVGDPVNLKLDEPVMAGGQVVIAKGALVRGRIPEAKRAGRLGRGGKLNMRVESVSGVDGTRIPLRAAKGNTGDNKTGTTVALTVLFGPLGLLKSGKDAEIKAGTPLVVFTDSTVAVHTAAVVAPSQPAP